MRYSLWLLVMLPVSLQVLEAGDGGGGMSNLSAFSLFDELLLVKFAANKSKIGEHFVSLFLQS